MADEFENSQVPTERETQNKVIRILRDFDNYEYLGNLSEQENKPYIESILKKFLIKHQGCTEKQAEEATKKLRDLVAQCHGEDSLYDVNKAVYKMFRYGTSVSQGLGRPSKKVFFYDAGTPENNFFHIAEEVTVRRLTGEDKHRRPDVVIYVNGIAVCVLELKKATVSVREGIRQNIRNQQCGQITPFFSTVQLLLAGSESEGVYYGTILTKEKYYLRWKEPVGAHYHSASSKEPTYKVIFPASEFSNELQRSLLQMLRPGRLIDFINNFVVFDGGIKKVARPNQYFALQAARERCLNNEGGIIWHTQGSGKSLTMIWLAQWILETIPKSRVVVITDRDELDTQITNGFIDADKHPVRATSGEHLIKMLNGTNDRRDEQPEPDLITTLVHKFGIHSPVPQGSESCKLRNKVPVDYYLEQVADHLPKGFKAKGKLFVFVDECHRTQGGVLNKAMRKIMGDDVMLIGFTGTPLFKVDKDKLTSREAFGPWISTYKYDEAVRDKVVLDLRYEARSVDRIVSDKESLDELFEKMTENLTPAAKTRLQKRWAVMQNLYSAREPISRVVAQIKKDFTLIPCLREGWGNAMLVADSVYQAFRYWSEFERDGEFVGKTAVVTSYDGKEPSLTEGFSDSIKTQAEFKHEQFIKMIGDKTPEKFEEYAKNEFVNNPGSMKILIVVDKLITGFDAPAATYMYIDSEMHNHTLFQAICRVNRTNGERKQYGYIVDYRNLFDDITNAIGDYTNGAFKEFDKQDVAGLLKNRLKEAKKDLDEAVEKVHRLAEPVELPREMSDFFNYFCCNPAEIPEIEKQQEKIAQNQNKREDFYNACAELVRAYTAIALEMDKVGYTKEESDRIYKEVKKFDDLRTAIMHNSGDFVDLHTYDADMRALLDDYIVSPRAEVLQKLDDFSFLDIIDVNSDGDGTGLGVDDKTEEELGGKRGVAETLYQNVRRVINRKRDTNPEEYRKFSEKIDRLLEEYQQSKIEYKELLKQIKELTEQLKREDAPDPRLDDELKKALYDNLGNDVELALKVCSAVEQSAQPGFRSNPMRKKIVERAIRTALSDTDYDVNAILAIVIAHTEFVP